MEQFKRIVIGFVNGTVPAEQAQGALADLVMRDPSLSQPCIQMLNQMYGQRQLTPQIYTILREALINPQKFGGSELDPLQAFDSKEVPPETPSGSTSGADGSPTGGAADGEDAENKTVFRTPTQGPRTGTPTGMPTGTPTGGGDDGNAGETQYRPPTTGHGSHTGARTGTGTSGGFTSGSSNWSSPSAWTGGTGAGDGEPVKIGSIIKDRFVLEELIGKGGMGMVYKARDMRKEEAQDRFPYVALKVLNEEFKQHPESLKALQRESRKAQQLAHPNIVNVYDFDRDGGNVYMTMELLEGEPLDVYIRRNKGSGMSWSEALPLIKGMCLAIEYAHGHRIIHSDFKPGNCFFTKEGSVKVFDFGIARAAKRSGDLQGEETKFDAGSLGAYTPAYATCEMIDGEEPDRRDDVYALACTIYELLAGKHPFQKRSAADALRKKWTPAPIDGLSRSRNKALARGLALTREKRTKSALALLQELNPRETNLWVKVAAASGALLLLAFVAFKMVPDYLYNKELEALSVRLGSDEFSEQTAAIEQLDTIEADDKRLLLGSYSDQIIASFDAQVGQAFNRELDLYDYPAARAMLDKLTELYPDSSRVMAIEEQVEKDRQELQAELTADYDRFLEARQLLPQEGEGNDIFDLRDTVAQIDPNDQLLQDARLPQALAEQARASAAQQDFDNAERYLNAGLELAPGDTDLINVRDEVRTQRNIIERAAEIAALESRLRPLTTRRVTVDDIGSSEVISDLRDLRDLQPNNTVLQKAQSGVQTVLARQIDSDIATRNWQIAADRVSTFSGIVADAFVDEQTARIEEGRRAFEETIISLIAGIDKAIATGQLDQPAGSSAIALLAQLEKSGASALAVSSARDRIAHGYIVAAQTARSQNDWEAARRLANKASAMQPSESIVAEVREEMAKVDNQETLATKELQEREITGMQARIDERFEQTVFGRGDIDAVLASVTELETKFGSEPEVSAFVNQARSRIASRVSEQALQMAQSAQWNDADALIAAAENALGRQQQLADTRAQIASLRSETESKELRDKIRTAEASLADLLKNPVLDDAWGAELDRQVAALQKLEAGNLYAREALERAAGLHLRNARELREDSRWVVAQQQLARAQELAPTLPSVLAEAAAFESGRAAYEQQLKAAKNQAEIDAKRQLFDRELQADRLDRAAATLAELSKLLPADNAFVTTTAPTRLLEGRLRVAAENARLDRFTNALKQIDLASALGIDDPRIADARAKYSDQKEAYLFATTGGTNDIRAMGEVLGRLQASMEDYAAFAARLQRLLKRRIEQLAPTNRGSADNLYSAAREHFPALTIDWPAVGPPPPPPPIDGVDVDIEALKNEVTAIARSGSGNAIRGLPSKLNTLRDKMNGYPEFEAGLQRTVKNRIEQLAQTNRGGADILYAAAQVPFPRIQVIWPPPPPPPPQGKPCSASLAGQGKKRNCYDELADNTRLPILVVIPGLGGSAAYAMSRSEVSIKDFNLYCERSGACNSLAGNSSLPATNLEVSQMQAYAGWLSSVSGAQYSLPTLAQWQHAARAGGGEINPGINCVRNVGGHQADGFELVNVSMGGTARANDWGLRQIVGNAQEVVSSGGSYVAAGGAYSDKLTDCTPDFTRAVTGAEERTGFRIVRIIN